ncbi:MAG: cytochrome C oxidase subunit IV family protein [Dehalococcoidia bacterium]|nr:cytochrome C oxidase subunit IV family protein [Dehalococcoidia bacterium]
MSNGNHGREAVQQRRGLMVFIALAVLTVIEYFVAVSLTSTPLLVTLLAVAAGAKCWAITVYFMHVTRLWRGEEVH